MATADSALYAHITDPVYDIPGETLPSSSAKDTFAMTLSTAYGVSTDCKLPDKLPGDTDPPFAMMSSLAYGV